MPYLGSGAFNENTVGQMPASWFDLNRARSPAYGAVVEVLASYMRAGDRHMMAAGCSYDETLNQIKRGLLSKLISFLLRQHFNRTNQTWAFASFTLKMGEEPAGLLRVNQVERHAAIVWLIFVRTDCMDRAVL